MLPKKEEDSLEASFIKYLYSNQIIIDGVDDFPAHLHINILPIAQRKGYGSRLINVFLNQLRSINIKGVHLVVNKKNQNAIRFYNWIGFQELKELEASIVFGKKI